MPASRIRLKARPGPAVLIPLLAMIVPTWVPSAARADIAEAEVGTDERVMDSRQRAVNAVRLQGRISIDGRLDEPEWERARPVRGFLQDEPFEGEPAMEDTEVRILYDDQNVYIGARLYDSDPSRIARPLTRRGQIVSSVGYFEVSLDPNRDRTTGYRFRVTAAGVQQDAYLFNDTGGDGSWDGVWESAVSVDEHGWVAEIRIPLSQLRYEGNREAQVWGVNFARRRVADNERTTWAWTPRNTPGTVSRFGQLHGLQLPEPRRHLELVPYVMTGLERTPAPDTGNPFYNGREQHTRAGLDIRYGLGSTFVLDAALNPDFGQVEVDPQVINLGAFETFFPERRPFFSRDDRLFRFGLTGGQNQLVHSRRIGRTPQGRSPGGASHVASADQTTVLAATKLSGRTSGGLSIGVLGALTDREHGWAYFEAEDESVRFVAEPRTQYGIVSLAQDLREGQTQVGGMVTVVDRDLPANGAMDFLTRRALSGGVSFGHRWADREWGLSGHFARSHVSGSEAAMLRIQRSPAHYHQRPDQDYLTLDPNATSLSGSDWEMVLDRNTRHWSTRVFVGQRTPGFEVNDFGFYSAGERMFAGTRVQYREPSPAGGRLQNYSLTLDTAHSWRNSVRGDYFSRDAWSEAYRGGRLQASASFTFRNWWGLWFNTQVNATANSSELTRGGPLMANPGSRGFNMGINTDQRQAVTWNGWLGYSEGSRGGGSFGASTGVNARPTNRLHLNANVSYDRRRDVRQYVTQVQDPSFTSTYGGRYFFSDVQREEVSLNLQASYLFSPTLSIEVFAQPLIAAGDFVSYKQLANAASFDFIRFVEGEALGLDGAASCVGGNLCRGNGFIYIDYTGNGAADASFREQNFNIRSLRGNAVLRWEYQPGSRLYAVWQHQRRERVPLGDLDLARDGRALLEGRGDHMFMVKVDRLFDF